MTEQQETENKERRRKARAALVRLRSRLRQGCASLSSASEWYDAIAPLIEWQRDYGDLLSSEQARKLRGAMDLTDTGRRAIARACRVLDAEIGNAIHSLPAPVGAALGAWVAGIVVVAAIVAGGVTLYRSLNRVEVVVRNVGCGDIPIQQDYADNVNTLISLLGLDPPDYIPHDAEIAFGIGVFPMTVMLERQGNAVVATVGGLSAPIIEVGGGLTAELNGIPLGAQPLTLGRAGHYELVLLCP